MTVTGQSPVVYTYDDAGRVTSLVRDTLTVGMSYDSVNRRTTVALPNGIVSEYSYDANNQITAITYKNSGTAIGDLDYTYDAAGLRTAISGSWARTGLPQVLSSAAYDAANELTLWNGASRQYDANGGLVSDGLTSYTWNARQQLGATGGDSPKAFAYDSVGRRNSTTIGGVFTQYAYDGPSAVTEVRGGESIQFINGEGVDELFSRIDSGGTKTLLSDAIGSTMAITDSARAVTDQFLYDPFGNGVAQGTTVVSERFTGREQDDAGLYYYRARYYRPGEERFISEDAIPAILASDGPNLYAYAMDNPVQFTDPFGLQRIQRPPLTYPPPTPAGCTKVGMTYVCNPPPGPVMCPVREKQCTPYVNRSLYYDCLMIRLVAPNITYPSPGGLGGAAIMTGFECADNATRCVETGMPPPGASARPDPQIWHQPTKPPQWGARPPWR
jgi:RHS repeat-associated protein